MRRNKLFILGLFFAFVAVLSLTLVSGTWAKYTSSVTASSTARVAKWSWEINDVNTTESFTFNLFETAKVFDTDGNAEADVTSADSAVVIAPGTKGSINLKIENISEVTGKVVAEFAVTKPATLKLNYKFSIVGTDLTSAVEETTSGNVTTYKVTLPNNLAARTGTETLTFAWEWPFEVGADDSEIAGNDEIDTALGKLGTDTVKVTAKLTFIQVD